MRFEHDGRTFVLICVMSNSSYALEMSECHPGGRETFVMGAVRPFGSQSVQVSMLVENLPYEVVKVFRDTVQINLVDRIEPHDIEEL
jgi:hypothetical protein